MGLLYLIDTPRSANYETFLHETRDLSNANNAFFAAELTGPAATFVSLYLPSYLGGQTLLCPKSMSLFLCTLTNLDETANKRNGAN